MRDVIRMYQIALLGLTSAALAALFALGYRVESGWAVAGLALLAALAERGRVRLGGRTESSISLLPTVFSAALFGPISAMFVAAASLSSDLPLLMRGERLLEARKVGRPYLKWGIYTCARALTGAAAGAAADAAGGIPRSSTAGLALATVTAAVIAEPLDVAFVTFTAWLRGSDVLAVFRAIAPVTGLSIPLYAPVVTVLVIAYREVSPWTLPLFFVPALAAQRMFVLYQEQRRLAEDLGSANAQLEAANVSFATALVATLEARDRYTAGHSAAVAVYAHDISARLGLEENYQRLAHLAGLVHDIGKIGLPAGLLEKPGALTLDERRQMEQHSVIGARILTNVETYAEVASIVRHHHERVDGQGYPDGLEAGEIPLLARIIAVADAYNAMTSDRPYRDAMPSRVARLRLAQAADTQFDTAVVAAFEAILATAPEPYRMGLAAEFELSINHPAPDTNAVAELIGIEAGARA